MGRHGFPGKAHAHDCALGSRDGYIYIYVCHASAHAQANNNNYYLCVQLRNGSPWFSWYISRGGLACSCL